MPRPAEPLAGMRVLVAGAGGGVGTAVSRALAAQGADLVLHGHDRSPAVRDLADELQRLHGTRPLVVHGDITEPERIAEVRDILRANACNALDGIVNCTTGFDGRPVGLADLSVKEFRRVVDVDLVGSYVLVHELLPLLTARPGGRVVLFSSLAAQRGRPGAAHLCAAKAGVQGLALGLARDLAPQGVAVHVLAPGPIGPHGPTGVPTSTATQVADVVAVLVSPRGDPLREQVLVLQGNTPLPVS
jgi:3-oxoacyl-[acyl-carrier protein] reductase